MHVLQRIMTFLGRLFLGAVFLVTAIYELVGWPKVQQMFLEAFSRWMSLYHGWIRDWLATTIPPAAAWIVLGATLLKLLGSLMLILGWHARLGCVFLLVFLIPNTVIMHDFWHLVGGEGSVQMMLFWKNIAIMGGLLLMATGGNACTGAKERKKEG